MSTLALSDAPATVDARQLGPLTVGVSTREDAADEVMDAIRRKQSLCVAFANTHLLYCALREPQVARALQRFRLFNDGIGVTLLARLLCGGGFKDNLNGTDFTPHLLAQLPQGVGVFLVGGERHVVTGAALHAKRTWPHLRLCGYRDGFSGSEAALDDIAEAKPNLVLVGMGNPEQERWITRAVQRAPQTVFIGVGALFDFMSGAVPRAPAAMRALRLEWAFRVMQEPRRLWRRYTVEILVILAALMRSSGRA